MGTSGPAPTRELVGRGGQSTLAFVILISGIVIEIAIAGSFITYFLSTSVAGERLSARAFAAAAAGVWDAELRIVRDKEFAGTGPVSYTFSVGADSTSLVVSRATPDAVSYQYLATSTGTAASRNRRLVAVFVADQITGLVQVQSVVEQPF